MRSISMTADQMAEARRAQREAEQQPGVDFLSMLAESKNGRVVAQLGKDMKSLVADVQQYGAKGKLSLVIEVVPARMDDGKVKEVDVIYKTNITAPRPQIGKTLFFVTEDAKLTRDDPAQMEMEM